MISVGFAKSNCQYEDVVPPTTPAPSVALESGLLDDDYQVTPACRVVPKTPCSANCEKVNVGVVVAVEGRQTWENSCGDVAAASNETGPRTCSITCSGHTVVRAIDAACPDTAWSECSKNCMQNRRVVRAAAAAASRDHSHRSAHHLTHSRFPHHHRRLDMESLASSPTSCDYTTELRPCYTGDCPVTAGDYLVFLDMKVSSRPLPVCQPMSLPMSLPACLLVALFVCQPMSLPMSLPACLLVSLFVCGICS